MCVFMCVCMRAAVFVCERVSVHVCVLQQVRSMRVHFTSQEG